MADVASQQPSSRRPQTHATVAGIMRPPLTTVEPNDHVAAAAYLMKHAGATALVIVDAPTGKPVGIITETDITHAVADGKDLNEVRIHDLMTAGPVVIDAMTSIRAAAQTSSRSQLDRLLPDGALALRNGHRLAAVARRGVLAHVIRPRLANRSRQVRTVRSDRPV
jgi:CBS domain-containing protein